MENLIWSSDLFVALISTEMRHWPASKDAAGFDSLLGFVCYGVLKSRSCTENFKNLCFLLHGSVKLTELYLYFWFFVMQILVLSRADLRVYAYLNQTLSKTNGFCSILHAWNVSHVQTQCKSIGVTQQHPLNPLTVKLTTVISTTHPQTSLVTYLFKYFIKYLKSLGSELHLEVQFRNFAVYF